MGVCPRAAQVLTTLGISRKPDSSAKTIWAPSRAAFFLRAASSLVSNARCLLHSAPEHVALVGVCRLACHPPVLAGVMMRYSTKIGATTLRPIIVYFIDFLVLGRSEEHTFELQSL